MQAAKRDSSGRPSRTGRSVLLLRRAAMNPIRRYRCPYPRSPDGQFSKALVPNLAMAAFCGILWAELAGFVKTKR